MESILRRLLVTFGLSAFLFGILSGLPFAEEREPVTLIFSHAIHLKQVGMECFDCHSRVGESTATEDRNIPPEDTCLTCHSSEGEDNCNLCHEDPRSVQQIQTLLSQIRFNHSIHVSLAHLQSELLNAIETGRYAGANPEEVRQGIQPDHLPCSVCHRGMPEVDLGNGANMPEMADCMVCHTLEGVDAMNECAFCHQDEDLPFPRDHEPTSFFDAHSSESAELNQTHCRMCHTPGFNPCTQCH